MNPRFFRALACAFLFLAASCVSSSVTPLATAPEGLDPVPTDSVAVYSDTTGVRCDFDRVGIVNVDADESVDTEDLVAESKKAAGQAGANAIVMQGTETHDGSYSSSGGSMTMTSSPGGSAKALALYLRGCE